MTKTELLRKYGFRIHSRPAKGEATWECGSVSNPTVMPELVALNVAHSKWVDENPSKVTEPPVIDARPKGKRP